MPHTPDYYKANKDTLLRQRRQRYHEDPDYRAKALERARKYREAKRKAEGVDPTGVYINGKRREGIPTRELLDALGISKARLKYMQRVGYIPPALVTHPRRLYTGRQKQLIAQMDKFLEAHREEVRAASRTPEGVEGYDDLMDLIAIVKAKWST